MKATLRNSPVRICRLPTTTGEDCLYLNVFKAADASAAKKSGSVLL